MIKANIIHKQFNFFFVFSFLFISTNAYSMDWFKRCTKRALHAIDFIQDRNPCKKQKTKDEINSEMSALFRPNHGVLNTPQDEETKAARLKSLMAAEADLFHEHGHCYLGFATTLPIAQALLTHPHAQDALQKHGPNILGRLSHTFTKAADAALIPLYIQYGADYNGLITCDYAHGMPLKYGRTVLTQFAWNIICIKASNDHAENDKNLEKLQGQAQHLIKAGACLWTIQKKDKRTQDNFSFHQMMNFKIREEDEGLKNHQRRAKLLENSPERAPWEQKQIELCKANIIRLNKFYTYIKDELKNRVECINEIMSKDCQMPMAFCSLIHAYRDNEEYTKEEKDEVQRFLDAPCLAEPANPAKGDEVHFGYSTVV